MSRLQSRSVRPEVRIAPANRQEVLQAHRSCRAKFGDDAKGSPPLARQILVLSAIAIAVGLLAGTGASAFVVVEHHLQGLLWREFPHALGQERPASWLVLLLLVTGAVIVYLAEKLPGKGAEAPCEVSA